jgi:hypothetical protein
MTPPIYTFLWLFPLRRGNVQLWILLNTQGWFVPSLIEIGLLALEKIFFFNFQYIFTLLLLSPLHLKNVESLYSKDELCQVWLKLAKRFRRRIRKCKSLQMYGQWAIIKSEKKKNNMSFQRRWTKNHMSIIFDSK